MDKTLQRGRIVWTNVIDPQGNSCGPHAVIILTPNEDIAAATYLRGVVISDEYGYTTAEMRVELPWECRPGGHPRTGLKTKCAAICNWIVLIRKSDIHENNLGRWTPAKQLLPIVKKVAELGAPDIAVPSADAQ